MESGVWEGIIINKKNSMMKMKTLKEGIVAHADSFGELFKFSAEHTCRSMLHSLEEFANMELVTFKELTAGFFLGFEGFGMFT